MFWCGYFLVKLKQRGWRKKRKRRNGGGGGGEKGRKKGERRRRDGEGEKEVGEVERMIISHHHDFEKNEQLHTQRKLRT